MKIKSKQTILKNNKSKIAHLNFIHKNFTQVVYNHVVATDRLLSIARQHNYSEDIVIQLTWIGPVEQLGHEQI